MTMRSVINVSLVFGMLLIAIFEISSTAVFAPIRPVSSDTCVENQDPGTIAFFVPPGKCTTAGLVVREKIFAFMIANCHRNNPIRDISSCNTKAEFSKSREIRYNDNARSQQQLECCACVATSVCES